MKGFAITTLVAGLAAMPAVAAQPARMNPPLCIAAKSGDLAEVNRLLKTGTDPNTEGDDSGKVSALQFAAMMGHVTVVQALLDHGANVNLRGDGDTTALHSAVAEGQIGTATLLLDRGADIEAKTNEESMKMTPLHLAAMSGTFEMFDLLLARGANLNAKAIEDTTPIMWAASSGNTAIVKRILQIDPTTARARNTDGQTALDLVRRSKKGLSDEVRKRLKEIEDILSAVR